VWSCNERVGLSRNCCESANQRRCWSPRLLLLLVVLGQILLFVNQAASSHANKTIRIGYLMQNMKIAGAINVAMNDGLLVGYNFRYLVIVSYFHCFMLSFLTQLLL